MYMEKGIVELEELRSRLLDLTVRSNLLNYKPSPGRSIEVIDGDPADIYRLLVLDEKGLRFYPSGKASKTESEDKRIWKYPTFSKTAKYADLILHTPYTDIELRKKLYSLQNKSRTVFEEQGYPEGPSATARQNPRRIRHILLRTHAERRQAREIYHLPDPARQGRRQPEGETRPRRYHFVKTRRSRPVRELSQGKVPR